MRACSEFYATGSLCFSHNEQIHVCHGLYDRQRHPAASPVRPAYAPVPVTTNYI